jgi:hypothetical protein
MVSLASLAGERLFFEGDNSSGVSGDLESATQITTLMEGYWGMGSTVTSHGVTHKVGIGAGGRPGKGDGKGGKTTEADLLNGGLGERIEDKLEELLQRAEDLLKANRIAVLAVAHALETHKTVTGDDIEAIIEGRPGPLIDGRVYADPEFARVVEEYHAQAISAHQGHGNFEIALPTLNGHRKDGPHNPVVLRPDGTYAGPSPWSRPQGSVAPLPPVPPVWPEPVSDDSVPDGAVDEGEGVIDGLLADPVDERRAGPDPTVEIEPGEIEPGETGVIENGWLEPNGATGSADPILDGGAIDNPLDDPDGTGAGSEAQGRPADD